MTKTTDLWNTESMGKEVLSPRQKRSVIARAKFLEAVSHNANIGQACEAAGLSRSALREWRKSDETFAQEIDDATERAIDKLEQEAWRRAYQGVTKPVFRGGKIVGEITEYSDRLIEFLLTGQRRRVYGKDAPPVVVNNTINKIELVPAATPGDDAKVIDGKKADTTRTQKSGDDETQ